MFYLIEFLNIGNLDVAAEKNLVQIFKKIKIVPGHWQSHPLLATFVLLQVQATRI